MTVPGCLMTCPPRSVLLTYSGGGCDAGAGGLPLPASEEEKRAVHTFGLALRHRRWPWRWPWRRRRWSPGEPSCSTGDAKLMAGWGVDVKTGGKRDTRFGCMA
jgi:hypothetical protein